MGASKFPSSVPSFKNRCAHPKTRKRGQFIQWFVLNKIKMDPSASQTSTQDAKRPKACIGALYFAMRNEQMKGPYCAGFKTGLKPTDEGANLPSNDSIPGGNFKYMCVGYSAYDEARLLRHASGRPRSPGDPVQLPYCEGLEVISAAATQRIPGLMTTGGISPPPQNTPPSPAPEPPPTIPPSPSPRRGKTYVTGPELPMNGLNWEQFVERFDRMSRKILTHMQSNLVFMTGTAKKAAERVWTNIMSEIDRDKPR